MIQNLRQTSLWMLLMMILNVKTQGRSSDSGNHVDQYSYNILDIDLECNSDATLYMMTFKMLLADIDEILGNPAVK